MLGLLPFFCIVVDLRFHNLRSIPIKNKNNLWQALLINLKSHSVFCLLTYIWHENYYFLEIVVCEQALWNMLLFTCHTF